jgi:hypothetical protein
MNLVNCSEQNASVWNFSKGLYFFLNKNNFLCHLESICAFLVENTLIICMLLYAKNDKEEKTYLKILFFLLKLR